MNSKMIEINKSQEAEAPVESVWKLISDLDNEQKYWHVLRNVKILSKSETMVEREATIKRGPMGEAKSFQILVVDPRTRSTTLTMTKGPMLGTRKITITPDGDTRSKINVDWKFEIKGIPSFAKGFVKDNISEGTEKALTEIANEATQ